jgi:hypothetical protein
MREGDFLFAVAEVGIALAGFATIVVAFTQRFSGLVATVASSRLDSTLRCSLLGVFGALIPYIPQHLGLTPSTVWRISSLLLGVGWLTYYLYRIRSAEQREVVAQFMAFSNRLAMWIVHPAGILLSVLGALGLLGTRSGSVFLALLLVLLGLSANLFLQLMASLLGSPAAQQRVEPDVE